MIALALLLFLGLVLPNVALRDDQGYGRSLLTTAFYFLHVQSGTFPQALSHAQLSFGFNVTYVGLGLHELGLLLTVATFWSFYPEEFNRWIYRLLVIGGWLLAASQPFVIAGWILMGRAGVPADLGWAWLPVLISGVAITVAARRAKFRIDNSWYLSRPELM